MKRCLKCQTKYEEAGTHCPGCGSTSFSIDDKVAAMMQSAAEATRAVAVEVPSLGIRLLLLGIGVILGYLCIVDPLSEGHRRASFISFSTKGAALAVPTLAYGLLFTFSPTRATELFGHPRRMNRRGLILSCVLAVVGVAVAAWLESHLKELGYERPRFSTVPSE